jgi:hypothetical protein
MSLTSYLPASRKSAFQAMVTSSTKGAKAQPRFQLLKAVRDQVPELWARHKGMSAETAMRETCHANPKKCVPRKMVQSLKLRYRTAIEAIRSTGSGAGRDGEHVDDRAWREFAILRKEDKNLQLR